MAKDSTKASLAFKSDIRTDPDLRPNHIMAHSLMKKMGKNTKKKTAKAIANPGRVCRRPTKKTYFAQNKEVPGNPIVIRTPKTEATHRRGAESATPPR